jgi:NhaP-type Na+/H+ or K+/H+ antiporter
VTFDLSYLLLGTLLVGVAVAASFLRRLPLTETMIYLVLGALVGPLGAGLYSFDARAQAPFLERLAEIAVIVSLFTAGLKLRLPLRDPQWWTSLRLAFASMTLTVGFITLAGVVFLGLPLGAAVLLGGILAPTDPVLASDVQIESVHDRDRLRFSLTGEAGLNDGTAFPFVMLGLGLLGLHELGSGGWRWWTMDVVWAIGAGLGIGAAFGSLVARLVLWLRREHHEGVGRDEFLALGLIALSYGAALCVHAYGFLAVFAAGVALRAVERRHSGAHVSREVLSMETAGRKEDIATDREKAPAHMAGAVLAFNEQIERILEVTLVLVLAAALHAACLGLEALAFAALLFLLIRPLSVVLGLLGATKIGATERGLISWFGIRGIGSLYYLAFAIDRGLPADLAARLTALTLTTIAVSIVIHGLTVNPLMTAYRQWREKKSR